MFLLSSCTTMHTHNTLLHFWRQTCGFSPHQAIPCNTSWASCNANPFWHYPPRMSLRSHKLRAQSHKTTPLQTPVESSGWHNIVNQLYSIKKKEKKKVPGCRLYFWLTDHKSAFLWPPPWVQQLGRNVKWMASGKQLHSTGRSLDALWQPRVVG